MTTTRRLRVGIPVIGYKSWMGGVSYIELLVKALISLPEDERPELYQIVTEESLPRLELHQHFIHLFKAVIFVGPYNKDYPDFIYTPTHRDLLEVLDFYFPLMNVAWPTAKAACWIPDFQHLHLPQFFHEGECKSRSESFAGIAANAKLLILSSRDSESDFRRFFPGSKAVTRVLSFYAMPQESWYQADCAEVQQKYGLPDDFLICCNQFWAHKNHAMLFTAIGQLHAEGTDIHLVCTGHTEDYRCPGFFDDLKERIRSMGVEHLIHILGSIPRHDQIQLVRRSMALVQPSLFEGWSTVIEDCRALGKIMLLSDLPVHQEQAPRNGQYFDRTSLPSLKAKLKEMVPTLTPGPQYELERQAREEAHRLVLSYGRQFCAIARDSIAIEQGETVAAEAPTIPPATGTSGISGTSAKTGTAGTAGNSGGAGTSGNSGAPRITIVTPSFNQAEHLENCIQSVLSQGYPNLEYIIMDGGSTDGSVEIIKKYERHLAYWQSQPDGGQYRAVNEGFRRSTGDIMGWLNSDDMLHPGGLQVLADVFTNRPDVDFLTARRVGFDGEGNLRSYGFETQTWSRTELLRKELIHQVSLFVMQEATYWRRSLWEKAGGTLDFSYKLAADFELWLRFSRHAKLHTVDALVGGFRYYSGGQRCNQFREEYIAECDDVINRERQVPSALSTEPPPPLIAYPVERGLPERGLPERGLAPSQEGACPPRPTGDESKPSFAILVPKLPKITIVTPSFNQAAFLEECLDSVLSQNYPNLEYIVMDGGSRDGSADIIRKYEKHLAYWQSRLDGGHYLAVNEGFGRSTGEIMAWLNSDDKYHPGAFRLVADAFRFFPETSWITGSPTGWDASGAVLYMASAPPLWSREKYLAGEIGPPHIQQESTFWRRSLWDLAGGTLDTELELAADMELWTRFFRHGQLTTLHAPLGGFRNHPGQKTATMLERYNAEAAQVIERERRYFQATRCPALAPAPTPLQVADVESRAHTSVTAENFGAFTYSRTFHFAYFAGRDLELYGAPVIPSQCDLKVYQELLVYSFIRENVPAGARILEVGGGASPVLAALKNDYDCWKLEKPEGLGNGIETDGIQLVRERIGSFTPELPDGSFDAVFSTSVLEHIPESEENFVSINRDLDRLLKPGGWSLHCLDVVASGRYTWSNSLLPYLFKANRTVNRWAPFEQLYPDPYVYAMSEAAYDRYRKPATGVPFREHGFPLSYNVLWQKPCEVAEKTQPALGSPLDKGGAGGIASQADAAVENGPYLVSAIVSTYNSEKFFRGCLENLLRQTLYQRGELEIIVIDSGSQQNEGEIAREVMAHHPHIVYRRTERETLYAAWNRGIALARGRFLTHANTDDRHRADCFEIMARELERSGKGLAYVDALMTCGKNETFEENGATKKWLLPDFNLRQALMDCPFGCQVMWTAEAHREVGMFDPAFKRAGDYEFFLRLALKRGALHIPEPLALYHESMDNLSYQSPREVAKEVQGFIESLRRDLPLEEIYPFLREDSSVSARVAALVDFGNHLMGSSGSVFTDTGLAKEYYRRALELVPGDPEIISNIAVAELVLQRPDRAAAAIMETASWTPRLTQYRELLARGEVPELNLIQIRHPGLAAMPPVKLPQEIRVPLESHSPAPRQRSSRYPTVVIDGIFFMYDKAGISRVWLSLLNQWAGSEFGDSIVVLDRIGTAPRIAGLRYRMVPGPANPQSADRAMLQQVCDEEKADLFISTYHTTPLTTPSLFLCHDMIPELSGLYNLQHAQWQEKRHALQRASAFITVSQNTARDLQRLYPEFAGRIEVAHCGIDRATFSPASEGEIREFRSRYGIEKPFFLFVGKRSEQKNGKLLFQAFSRLSGRDSLAVACIGGPPELEPEVAALTQGADVRLLNLSDHELSIAYSCAEALVYPSTYEGFGLPVLEAMACGCPVITCQNSSLPEVAGTAALFIAEDDPAQLADAMVQVRRPEVRGQLVALGQRQVENFSWEKMADTIREAVCRMFAPAQTPRPEAASQTDSAAASAASTASTASTAGTAGTAANPTAAEMSDGEAFPQPLIMVRAGDDRLPTITVVTPSFNQGTYLEECIDSVLSQRYPRLEYIIMDGGSSDGSVEIIKKYEKHLAYWQSRPDGGQYRAVDEGFRRSRGEVMAWLNSDDKYHPGSLWLVGDTFRCYPEVAWLMGNPTLFDEQGVASAFSAKPPVWCREQYLAGAYHSPYIQQESVFWRRSLWEKAGGGLDLSLELAADMELWTRFFRHERLYTMDAPLAGFRTHEDQKSARQRAEYHREADQVVERERQLFRSRPVPLEPAPEPIRVPEVIDRAGSRISPENFGLFTYSRRMHFSFFRGYGTELYRQEVDPASCDLRIYQELLVYGFIRQNIPHGSSILQLGGKGAPVLEALKENYRCWQLTSAPVAVAPAGVTLVSSAIGDFPAGIPAGGFDFIFSTGTIEPALQEAATFRAICDDVGRLLKPGGLVLNCFELIGIDGGVRSGGLLPYLFQHERTMHGFAPLRQTALDPYVFAMDRASYDRHRKAVVGIPFEKYGFPFSYNVLWTPAPKIRETRPKLTRSGMARPKISLVIPSYNYAQYLGDCLDSILSQEYPNLELIVMDGGSTDGTVEIIKKYERDIAFWRSHRDDGQYAAIEEGLNRATGDLMGWLNADDMFHPGAFETVSTIFMEHPEIEWVMGRPNSFDEAGNQKHILSFLPMNSRAKYLADEELIQQEGTFWRRGLWERSGSYIDTSLKLAADLELWARFFRSAKLYSVEALIAGFRDHPLQKSKDKAGYTEEANRVLAREREIFAAEKRPYSPPAPLPILVGDRPPRYPQAEEQRLDRGVAL